MQRRRRYTNLKYSDTEWLYHRKLSLIKEEHFEKYQCLPKLWPDESLLSPLGNLSSFSDDFRYGSLCKPTWVKHIPMWMLWRLCEREIERWQPYLPDSDYCLTTISRKASKAGFPSVFNGLRNVRRTLTNLAVIRTMIKNTAFYQDTPENSDRRHCSCQALSLCKKQDANSNAWVRVLLLPVPTVPPHDTLCTYGAKQLKLLGFSRWYLFWFSLMACCTLLDTIHQRHE